LSDSISSKLILIRIKNDSINGLTPNDVEVDIEAPVGMPDYEVLQKALESISFWVGSARYKEEKQREEPIKSLPNVRYVGMRSGTKENN